MDPVFGPLHRVSEEVAVSDVIEQISEHNQTTSSFLHNAIAFLLLSTI